MKRLHHQRLCGQLSPDKHEGMHVTHPEMLQSPEIDDPIISAQGSPERIQGLRAGLDWEAKPVENAQTFITLNNSTSGLTAMTANCLDPDGHAGKGDIGAADLCMPLTSPSHGNRASRLLNHP